MSNSHNEDFTNRSNCSLIEDLISLVNMELHKEMKIRDLRNVC